MVTIRFFAVFPSHVVCLILYILLFNKNFIFMRKILLTFLCSIGIWAGLQAQTITLHVETPGSLSGMIASSKKYQITDLVLTGTLNGLDIILLRDMAGSDKYGSSTSGKLETLDISGVDFASNDKTVYLEADRNDLVGTYSIAGNQYPPDTSEGGIKYVFYNCHSLKKVICVDYVREGWFENCSNLEEVTITEGESGGIEDKAFRNCTSLKRVNLPDYYPDFRIGTQAFENCTALETFVIPENFRFIGEYSFRGCTNLHEIDLGGIKFLNCLAFDGCDRLSKLYLPATLEGLTFDEYEVLRPFSRRDGHIYGNGLEDITVDPDNTVYASSDGVLFTKNFDRLMQFPVKKKVLEYEIPYGVDTVDERAFRDVSLEKIILPATIKTVVGAFQTIKDVKEVYVYAAVPPELDFFPDEITKTATLYVPKGTYNDYWLAYGWGDFFDIKEVDVPVSVEDGKMNFAYRLDGDCLVVTGFGNDVPELFDTAGRKQCGDMTADGVARFTLPAHGLYVLKCGGESIKIRF